MALETSTQEYCSEYLAIYDVELWLGLVPGTTPLGTEGLIGEKLLKYVWGDMEWLRVAAIYQPEEESFDTLTYRENKSY